MSSIKLEPNPAIELVKLTEKEYKLISGLVYQKFGINLGEQKKSLIVGRLNKILKQSGFETFQQYYDYVLADDSGAALTTLIDRISTNHTFFYRENDHFEYFAETAIPEIIASHKAQNRKDIRIWCAGCSSGEESYTIAMLLRERLEKESAGWDIGVLATDISTNALNKAIAGVYHDDNVEKLPSNLKNKYLVRHPAGGWRISDNIKSLVLHRKLNLISETYPFKKKFQAVFCRNVMIYFDKVTRNNLIGRFDKYLEDKGWLFIGHSETLGRDHLKFEYLKPALYRKI